MRTGLLIANLEQSFTTSFKHAGWVQYGVEFKTSDIETVLSNLEQLKQNMKDGKASPHHVGYKITLKEVERVQALLIELLTRWKQQTNVPPHAKLYVFLQQLRDMETQTPTQLAKEIVKEIITPQPPSNATKDEVKQAKIEAIKKENVLKVLRKQNKKH